MRTENTSDFILDSDLFFDKISHEIAENSIHIFIQIYESPTLTSINGLWYVSFGQDIYILENLGYWFLATFLATF